MSETGLNQLPSKTERTEVSTLRWMCGVSLRERQPSTELRISLGVEPIGYVMRSLQTAVA